MIETVVTVGVSAWAWTFARASGQPPLRWSAATMAISFVIHRVGMAVYLAFLDPADLFSKGAELWRSFGPFLASAFVFVAAPIVLGLAVPNTPRRRR